MNKRPAILSILGVIFLLEPITRLGLNTLLFDLSIKETLSFVFNKHWFIHLPISLIFVFVGHNFLNPSKNFLTSLKVAISAYAIYTVTGIISYINDGMALEAAYFSLILCTTLISMSLPLTPCFKNLFTDSSKRWWQQDSRYHLNIEAEVINETKMTKTKVLLNDISNSGISISSKDLDFDKEDVLRVNFSFGKRSFSSILNKTSNNLSLWEQKRHGFAFNKNQVVQNDLNKILKALKILKLERNRSMKTNIHKNFIDEIISPFVKTA